MASTSTAHVDKLLHLPSSLHGKGLRINFVNICGLVSSTFFIVT